MNAQLIFGKEYHAVSGIHSTLQDASESHFDFVVVPLFHPRLRRDSSGISASRIGAVTRSDRELPSKDWQSNVVGSCSAWFDFDNTSSSIQTASEDCLRQECSWACHLGLQAVLLPTPCLKAANYARVVKQICEAPFASFQQLWLRIPLSLELDCRNTAIGQGHVSDGWEVWDSFRHLVGHHHRLSIVLELTDTLPPNLPEIMSRWAAEPIKAIIIPTKLFIENKSGHPVLSKRWQSVLVALLRFRLHVIFTGHSPYPNKFANYIAYTRHLKSKLDSEQVHDLGEQFTAAYRDTLQAPLQPLMDNLESQTYEVFERDPVKYARYEAATRKALVDVLERKKTERNGGIDSREPDDEMVIITVVGAGRGPLVAAALSAAASVSVPVRIYAVEKNENAVITLKNRVIHDGWTNVTIVEGDMRAWRPPELADIMISELLGSWGDNELSPECLDGAQVCLKPDTGISIPFDYTSFIAPISTSKLWMCAKDMLDGKGLDTPYVVKLHACHYLAESKPLFRFQHPNRESRRPFDNRRHARLEFTAATNATIHGFSGTFESTLYADETLSIAPHSHSPGMFSWFPLFLPLTAPMRVSAGDSVIVCIWRCVSATKVWYEWCVVSPVCTPIQNSGGGSYWVGL